jgi:hypothetical protein
MKRASKKIIEDWLSPERKRINKIISVPRNAEPGIIRPVQTTHSIAHPSRLESQHDGYPRSEPKDDADMIFGLIGTNGSRAQLAQPGTNGTADVIGSLYEQYCRALDDPQAAFSGDWSAPAAPEHASLNDQSSARHERVESIEALLSGARGLEDVFGKLAPENSPPASMADTVPEILRLFAPPEFKERPSHLPSALVRREHHASGIDSPVLAPRVLSQSEADL